MSTNLSELLIRGRHSIRQAMECIDRNQKGIVLVVDEETRLKATITDGDIRRAVLAGQPLDTSINELLSKRANLPVHQPVTARWGIENATLIQLMQQHKIRQIPLLDEQDHVLGLVTLDDLLPDEVLPLQAVIMAGGYGTRLLPLTEDLPKPMLPIGDRPLMELMIGELRRSGIRRVNITTHYLPEKIKDHFGDGSDFGIELNYVTEESPLGTAGALGLMKTPENPLLIINGDILTRLNFKAMLDFHRENQAALTVAVRKYDMNVPYGVVESEGASVRALREKPLLTFLVNAGIYLLEPSAHRYVPNGQSSNMTDLIQTLIDNGHQVVNFPIVEYWLDIGSEVDYAKAQDDMKSGGLRVGLDW